MTFRYSATLGGFDDTPLTDFARDKEVIAFREHFYTVNEVPHLTCVVHYQDAVVPLDALHAAREVPVRNAAPSTGPARSAPRNGAAESASRFPRRDGAPDPCAGLSESERALFNHLREWRSSVAHAEGLPPYLILTNRQVVAIVRARPDSPTALGHIDGIGPGKLERYGRAILARLHGAPHPTSGGAVAVLDSATDGVPMPDGVADGVKVGTKPGANPTEGAVVESAEAVSSESHDVMEQAPTAIEARP